MVNTGHPSRGCQSCKDRRIKCDLEQPECRRCVITGRKCPGAVAESDAAFISQNRYARTVKRKAKKACIDSDEPEASAAHSTSSPMTDAISGSPIHDQNWSDGPSDGEQHLLLRNASPVDFHLMPQLEDVAISFFFEHYAVSRVSTLVDVLRTFNYTSRITSEPAMDNTISAIALATFSRFPDMSNCHTDATYHYQRALGLVGKALSDPVRSKADETLLCVILMDTYERVAMTEARSKTAPTHASGAIALCRHRGRPEDLNSPASGLFAVVRSSMILECAARSVALEEQATTHFWFGEGVACLSPIERLFFNASSLPTLRRRAIELFEQAAVLPSVDQVNLLLADARVADTKLLHWAQTLPAARDFTTVIRRDDAEDGNSPYGEQAWNGLAHVYSSLWIGAGLNGYRMFRIFVQSVIARCYSFLEKQSRPSVMPTAFMYRATLHTVHLLVEDVAASVPAHLGDVADPIKMSDFMQIRRIKAQEALGAFYVLRPLWVASTVESIDGRLRCWMRERLSFKGSAYNLKQALVLLSSKAVLPMGWKSPASN